jgi:hypothetical protein
MAVAGGSPPWIVATPWNVALSLFSLTNYGRNVKSKFGWRPKIFRNQAALAGVWTPERRSLVVSRAGATINHPCGVGFQARNG